MTRQGLQVINYVVLVLLVIVGIVVWTTASTVASIVFGVLLLIGGLNVTGVDTRIYVERL